MALDTGVANRKLKKYLDRIGIAHPGQPSLVSLSELLQAHVLNIPFENLDVQLGIPLTTDVDAAFEKIVTARRGGWCYEMNGLFGWALTELGFEVMRVSAGVRRDERGDSARANHLCLLVRIPGHDDTAYLADVGFGGSMFTAMPMKITSHVQPPFHLRVERLEDGFWRFIEEANGDGSNYDFRPQPCDESMLSAKCEHLQKDPGSPLFLNYVAQKRWPDKRISLRGRVLTEDTVNNRKVMRIDSWSDFVSISRRVFDIDLSHYDVLWDKIVSRHTILFGD